MILLILTSLIPIVGVLAVIAFAAGLVLNLAEQAMDGTPSGERILNLVTPSAQTLLKS